MLRTQYFKDICASEMSLSTVGWYFVNFDAIQNKTESWFVFSCRQKSKIEKKKRKNQKFYFDLSLILFGDKNMFRNEFFFSVFFLAPLRSNSLFLLP